MHVVCLFSPPPARRRRRARKFFINFAQKQAEFRAICFRFIVQRLKSSERGGDRLRLHCSASKIEGATGRFDSFTLFGVQNSSERGGDLTIEF